MLSKLKASLESAETMVEDIYDMASDESDMDYIKDKFLDDPATIVVGSENDPMIKKLINIIPESEDLDDLDSASVGKMIESSIPGTVIHSNRHAAVYEDNIELELNDEDDDEDKPTNVDGILNDMTENDDILDASIF